VDRSATLYQQKLADIAGVYSLTGELCLDGRVTRTGATPKIALDRSYRLGVVKDTIWLDPDGFVDIPTPQQNELVEACWKHNMMIYPGAVLVFKYMYAIETFRNGWFAGQFTYGDVRDNPVTRFVYEINIQSYHGNWANLLYYIFLFLAVSAVSLIVGTARAIKVLIWGALGAVGFLLPNIVFSPEAIARYTMVPMSFLCWMSAVQVHDILREASVGRTRDRLTTMGRLLLGSTAG
ncbi:MAG: hypothetical protein J0H54_03450, partial [Rhizobiales bacterium]|nr:hypothetical protein [Hyphomicrobiales bacterium]